MMPGNTLADAERWAADIAGPAYAMDDETAPAERWAADIAGPAYAMDDETAPKVVDGVVEVVSEGHWKRFA